jgi:hypothetical protein
MPSELARVYPERQDGGAKGKEEEASPSGTRTDTNAGDAERLPWTE